MNFKNFLVKSLAITTVVVASMGANAGLLSLNGTEVKALDLNGTVSSFEEFYDYNGANTWSSNTGLEIANTVVLFTAELNNEYAIFATISAFDGGSKGSLLVSYLASNGSMLFVDDPDELVGTTGISFAYAANRNDGFIFAGLDDSSWNFDLSLNNASNVTGVNYISFTDGSLTGAKESSSLAIGTNISIANTTSSAVAVSAPATAALFLLGLGFIGLRRRKTA